MCRDPMPDGHDQEELKSMGGTHRGEASCNTCVLLFTWEVQFSELSFEKHVTNVRSVARNRTAVQHRLFLYELHCMRGYLVR